MVFGEEIRLERKMVAKEKLKQGRKRTVIVAEESSRGDKGLERNNLVGRVLMIFIIYIYSCGL